MNQTTIRTKNGTEFLVDSNLAEEIAGATWFLGGGKTKYVMGNACNSSYYLHRLLVGALRGETVDHINGNSLDNRLCNLRICTRSQNLANTPKTSGVSRFKGVTPSANGKNWIARIQTDKKRHLGTFATEEEAALAYNKAAKAHFGSFAYLNKIEGAKDGNRTE